MNNPTRTSNIFYTQLFSQTNPNSLYNSMISTGHYYPGTEEIVNMRLVPEKGLNYE